MTRAVAGEADGEFDDVEEGRAGEARAALPEIISGVEGECVTACCEGVAFEQRRVAPAVGVCFRFAQEMAIPEQANRHSRGRDALCRVENVSG